MAQSFKPGTTEVMALQADYISTDLNTFLKALITKYSRIPWAMDKAVSAIHPVPVSTALLTVSFHSAGMRALTMPAGTRPDLLRPSPMRPSLAMTTPVSTPLPIPPAFLASHGVIRSSSLKSESRLHTSLPSDY